MTRIPACLFKGVLQLVQPKVLNSSAEYRLPRSVMLEGRLDQREGEVKIPKLLWTYWNHPQPDAFVNECIQSWRLQCPDYEVRLVHPGNLDQYVRSGELPAQFAQLHPTKQSDWLRLYLVACYGGFWLDASTLLTSSLDWMQAGADPRSEFTGFYLEKFTKDAQFPVIESWAFGAVAGSPFITAWQKEFHLALIEEGTDAYLQRHQSMPGWSEIQQNIEDPRYLLIHITAQQVLRGQQFSRMALFKAEDTAYYYHRALRWKWYLLYPQLCLVAAPRQSAPIVKLRGGERRHFTEMFASHGGSVPGSTWHQALHPQEKRP
ncbi:capsular polysaccharide synthesis protein [Comamonas sp. lk]|uniref:glycosyltransferase family 32 protein n=1 Tax=Comamonas sp. lk TaxID=2201272 RepID=UPI000EB17AAF|nr:capsular polysaccharide synthesis protein [Comamonas sp. lk]